MTNFLSKIKPFAPVITRIGLAVVFLLFSYLQFSNPSMWTGFVPDSVAAVFGGNSYLIVILNAWFELVAGLMLIVGLQVRITSLLLALHLLGITASIGFSALGVRDFGLSIATLSIFFAGADIWSLDVWLEKKSIQPVLNM